MFKRPIQDKSIRCWLYISLGIGLAGLVSVIIFCFWAGVSADLYRDKLLAWGFGLLILTANCLILFLTVHMIFTVQKNSETAFLQKVDSYHYEYYQMALENESKIRVMYHEVANQIQVITELFDKGNRVQAEKIADELQDEFYSARPVRFCDNRIVNVILSLKQREAAEKDCMLEAQISTLPAELKISDLDLSMLLTNLTDNAIAATEVTTEREKTIVFKLAFRSGSLVLSISNPTELKEGDYSNKKLHSTKNEGFHGVGMELIRNLVKKYDGTMSVTVEDGSFLVRIVLTFS